MKAREEEMLTLNILPLQRFIAQFSEPLTQQNAIFVRVTSTSSEAIQAHQSPNAVCVWLKGGGEVGKRIYSSLSIDNGYAES